MRFTRPGLIFYGLNAIRLLSIIAMLLVFASSIFVLVKDIEAVNNFMKNSSDEDLLNCDYIENSTVPNQPAGVFWAVVNRLLIIFQIIALIMSEASWPMAFFDRFFPVLGRNFGLGPLGIFQGLIAASILSHHVDDFTLVAAFFLFSLGCVNMFLGLLFREKAKSKRSLRAHKEEAKDPLALPRTLQLHNTGGEKVGLDRTPTFARPDRKSWVQRIMTGSSGKTKVEDLESNKPTAYGFGRQGEIAALRAGAMISRPVEALPPGYVSPSSNYSKHIEEELDDDAETASSRSASPEPRFKSSRTAL
ncbi:hypothetical protein EIP91_005894 [Steccherinum ochraceum]|uniref:DUF7598 domain-containing protein n=1 Tax=Steccherinum ochraceum TaxID=92696 RepID=A0A4R0R952_9APHY|nr:hypothetical protein EIP91_005894 [Steccherinum ochraceum]